MKRDNRWYDQNQWQEDCRLERLIETLELQMHTMFLLANVSRQISSYTLATMSSSSREVSNSLWNEADERCQPANPSSAPSSNFKGPASAMLLSLQNVPMRVLVVNRNDGFLVAFFGIFAFETSSSCSWSIE
jgi:hypothetical protein